MPDAWLENWWPYRCRSDRYTVKCTVNVLFKQQRSAGLYNRNGMANQCKLERRSMLRIFMDTMLRWRTEESHVSTITHQSENKAQTMINRITMATPLLQLLQIANKILIHIFILDTYGRELITDKQESSRIHASMRQDPTTLANQTVFNNSTIELMPPQTFHHSSLNSLVSCHCCLCSCLSAFTIYEHICETKKNMQPHVNVGKLVRYSYVYLLCMSACNKS